ncbi:MAG: helix-turn-helix transcriptional regulator [Sphingomonadaceae bacterium]|nr:helix-turn-helix transcriptional regulator [Sphingomonadaceae bacterium]
MKKLREQLIGDDLCGELCGLPAALEAMGERWSFMILRAAFNGVHHFEEFQSELSIARNILSNRLQRLVAHGILERAAMLCDRRKICYRLTEKGLDLLPTMVALRQWGEKWGSGVPSTPVLVDARDHQPVRPVVLQAHDGRALSKHDLMWMDVDAVRPLAEAPPSPPQRTSGENIGVAAG